MQLVGFIIRIYQDVRSPERQILDMDTYHWGVGLAVTGRIRDIGQNVLQPSFHTRSSSSSTSYFRILFLIAFLEEAIIRHNIKIILRIIQLQL